jgi:Phosphoesterase family
VESDRKQDKFLRETFAPLLASRQWHTSRSLLIVTWDESRGWGWPNNRVPTILAGSPSLPHEGAVVDNHFDGYSVLRTIESAFGLGGLGRFDKFAEPLNTIFATNQPDDEAERNHGEFQVADLRADEAVTTRGGPADTFGRALTPATVVREERLKLTTS